LCGIAAGYNIPNAPEIATRILLGQDDRGTDATGVAFIKNGKISVVKKAVTPIEFYNSDDCPKDKDSIIAIAHNRAASSNIKDKSKDIESHPYLSEDGSLTICHNGSVPDDDTIRNLLENILGHKFESRVDSEVYLHLLEEAMKNSTTRNEAIKKMFEYVRGNLLILFNDGTLYGVPSTSFFIVAICDNQGYIASEVKALTGIIPSDKEVTLFKRDFKKDDQLVKFSIEDGNTKLELFGTWSEVKTVGNWIPNGEIKCDFCNSYQWCEKYYLNSVPYDRCIECFKAGKKVPLSQINAQRRRQSTRSSRLDDDVKNTIVVCQSGKENVFFSETFYCPICDKVLCKECFFDKEKHPCFTSYESINRINLYFPPRAG